MTTFIFLEQFYCALNSINLQLRAVKTRVNHHEKRNWILVMVLLGGNSMYQKETFHETKTRFSFPQKLTDDMFCIIL